MSSKSSRDQILAKLRTNQQSRLHTDVSPSPASRRHMVELDDTRPQSLEARFIQEAEALSCRLYRVADDAAALDVIRQLVGDDAQVISWHPAHIPLVGLADAFAGRLLNPQHLPPDDPALGAARVGITGVDAALAATGSLVLQSGAGKHRSASLLPDVHIAVVTADQIVADFETWISGLSAAAFRASSNIVIISGPSKTADIAQELIKGAHGPREVHIVLLPAKSL